jgi:hypothetical protein
MPGGRIAPPELTGVSAVSAPFSESTSCPSTTSWRRPEVCVRLRGPDPADLYGVCLTADLDDDHIMAGEWR